MPQPARITRLDDNLQPKVVRTELWTWRADFDDYYEPPDTAGPLLRTLRGAAALASCASALLVLAQLAQLQERSSTLIAALGG